MAGFEIVVRPVILPNIRPAPAQTLAPEDDPSKGICEIKGTSPHMVTLSHSMSVSGSEQRPNETQRRSDTAQVTDDTRSRFVEVKVANKIWMNKDGASGSSGGGRPGSIEQSFYQRVQESDNVRITRRDEIIKAK